MPPRRRQARASDTRPKWTERVQAAAALVAVPALVVALITYRDQQEINRSQLEMAQLERERYSKRYASRVAVWWAEGAVDHRSKQPQVRLQNRSMVPVTAQYFRVTGYPGEPVAEVVRRGYFVPAVEVPPCTVVTYVLLDPGGFRYAEAAVPPILDLWFADGESTWLTGKNGLFRRSARYWELPSDLNESGGQAVEVPGTRESAGDCGEGG